MLIKTMYKSYINITTDWINILSKEFEKTYFIELMSFLDIEEEKIIILPKKNRVFAALNKTSFNNTKVVIIGQDPYHGLNQANGLAFSVNKGIKQPPSLKNIIKELSSDLNISSREIDLSNWAKQGVLLLNSTLTVRKNQAGSHKNKGWETFTDKIITKIAKHKREIIFILWGKQAIKKINHIDTSKHFILQAPHPSPLSSYRGFFGCKHFSKTNKILKKLNKKPIKWIEE